MASEYVRQEWQYAWFDAEKVVTPILRLNHKTDDDQIIDDYQIIPDEIKLLHCEDFRDDAQYQAHLQNLIASLNAPVPPLVKLITVPSSADALATWLSLGHIDESHGLSTKGGPLQFPLGLLPVVPRTDATATQSLIAPGTFDQAYGPLPGDTILAFTANGEAHWFRIRRRDGA